MTNIKIEILEETAWAENPLGVFEPWHLYSAHTKHNFSSGPHVKDLLLLIEEWWWVKKYLIKDMGAHPSLLVPCYLWQGPSLALSTSPFAGSNACGQVGFFYVQREKVLKRYKCQRVGKLIRAQILQELEDVIFHLNRYINNDVDYSFIIQQVKHLGDSSGEHYNSREEALAAAEKMINKLGRNS